MGVTLDNGGRTRLFGAGLEQARFHIRKAVPIELLRFRHYRLEKVLGLDGAIGACD